MRSIPATVVFGLLTLTALGDQPRDKPVTGKTLLAHWTFDETEGAVCRDRAGGLDAAPEPGRGGQVGRMPGVLLGAVELHGPHALRVKGIPRRELERVSLAAWAQPGRMDRYMEIYRQECPHRVLFSFQEHGTVLSLGLDVGGYVECDGPIDPAVLLDGGWHHCAATFDGRVMRVYFDGKPVAELARPGKVRLQPDVPAYIGSLQGHGEHFDGLLDDLRIYGDALSAEEVAELYRGGAKAIEGFARRADQDAGAVYVRGGSFVEAMAGTRTKLQGLPEEAGRRAAGRVLARLKADYPREYEEFLQRAGVSPPEYLQGGWAVLAERARRLAELLLEYRPLTESQKAKMTGAERAGWAEAEEVARRLGKQDPGSPAWVEAMLAAGRRVQVRPLVHEAVAPYVTRIDMLAMHPLWRDGRRPRMDAWWRAVTARDSWKRQVHDAFPRAIVNTHPSLLPAFKGWHAVEDAFAAGVKVTGCTVHLATLEVDEGPILAQEAVPVRDGDTVETLHERIKDVERRLYPQVLRELVQDGDGEDEE